MSETQAPATEPVAKPISATTSIAKLAEALAKAQGAFPVIPKDSEVEVKNKEGKFLYSYKYADLTAIISATRPALSQNGLSFTQGLVQGGFVTTLMHSSGETLKTGFVPCELPKGGDMKAVAALITYVKRISLTAALGVSADEDVDAGAQEGQQGNTTTKGPPGSAKGAAAPPKQNQKPPAKTPPSNSAPADKDMMDQMLDAMIDRGVHENSVTNLITKGYGFKADRPPVWVWQEVMQLLSNEDCNDASIERKFKEVLKRREAKGGGK